MFRTLAAGVALGTTVLASACNVLPGPHSDLSGNYNLESVNGSAVPATLATTAATQGYTVVVQQGSVQLTSSKYISQLVLAISGNGQSQTATGVDSGTYTVHGSTVTFTSTAGGAPMNGTVSGNTLTIAATDPTFGNLGLQFLKQ